MHCILIFLSKYVRQLCNTKLMKFHPNKITEHKTQKIKKAIDSNETFGRNPVYDDNIASNI